MNYYNKLKKAVEELEQNQSITIKTPIEIVVNYLVKAVSSEVKQYTPQHQSKAREAVKASITNIYKNLTSTGKDYLLLKIDKNNEVGEQEVIFCFNLEERWGELNEGGNYDFIVERSERGTYKLADFNKNY